MNPVFIEKKIKLIPLSFFLINFIELNFIEDDHQGCFLPANQIIADSK